MTRKLPKILRNTVFTASGIFIIANILSNFLNFLFNAYMGRVLTVENFGLITFINTLVLLSGVFINSVGATVTNRVGFLSSHFGKRAAVTFMANVRKNAFRVSIILMILWVVCIPLTSRFFKIGDISSMVFFTPVFFLFLNGIIYKGYLAGNLFFIRVSVALLLEAFSKLLFAFLLQAFGFSNYAYLAIPLSLTVSFAALYIFNSRATHSVKKNKNHYAFPRRFLFFAVMTGLSASSFLTLDLVLVKHFLLPKSGGEYALLSLAGKMIFFFGSLFNGLILAHVSRHLGKGKNPGKIFSRLILGTLTLTIIAFIAIGFGGQFIMPIAFGSKVLPILLYLPHYSLAIALFTVSSAFVAYHLARHQFSLSVLSLFSSGLMIIGICFFHQNIGQITHVILAVSVFNFIGVLYMHLMQRNGRFILRNIIDLVDVLRNIPNQKGYKKGTKRILIFNWRDTKHTYGGGAEVYIHELSKRWVTMGYSVTLFCGNDGNNPRNEVIDGVQMIRRGGFYVVYAWAFIYYVLRLRGKYDVIIDTENGLPFFTPLYAREPIYCLMFHVHQDVFRKSLPKPLAIFAQILENRLMPWAYRRIKFITISESSKKEIQELGLGLAGIEIIYPGIDLKTYKPSDIKTPNPLIIYIGRLQMYKSVDVFIKSAKQIFKAEPHAQIIIAGDGEERGKLEELTDKLGLNKKIKFLGKISEKEKIQLYQKAWVAVNPSMKEGWGITTIEANACGTPVVASDVPGLRDSVKNPSTGFLVEYGNSQALSQKILKVIKDQELREDMEIKSVKWARNFEWNVSAERTLGIIL